MAAAARALTACRVPFSRPSLLQDAIVCLCGPPGMIQYACLPNLEKMGFKDSQIIQF